MENFEKGIESVNSENHWTVESFVKEFRTKISDVLDKCWKWLWVAILSTWIVLWAWSSDAQAQAQYASLDTEQMKTLTKVKTSLDWVKLDIRGKEILVTDLIHNSIEFEVFMKEMTEKHTYGTEEQKNYEKNNRENWWMVFPVYNRFLKGSFSEGDAKIEEALKNLQEAGILNHKEILDLRSGLSNKWIAAAEANLSASLANWKVLDGEIVTAEANLSATNGRIEVLDVELEVLDGEIAVLEVELSDSKAFNVQLIWH